VAAPILRHWRERIEAALDTALPVATSEPPRLHDAMRYATLGGGKRLRACLVYASGTALGAPEETLDAPACAVELIHAYSLAHDDLPCMDDDDLRRGKPACHRAYDEATALLVGDALQSRAFELLARADHLPADRRVQMIAALAQAIGSNGMAGGQAIDLAAANTTLSPEALADMHARKTGALIRAAVRLGVLAAPNAPSAALAALDEYARHVGLGFQIADDILDVEGETARIGKPRGSDAARGKATYASMLGLAEARRRAQEAHASALAAIADFGDNSAQLAALADFAIHRQS
jgi:farnesyl diphosphate synthase